MSYPYTLLMAMIEEVTEAANARPSVAASWPHATFVHHSSAAAASSFESAHLAPPVLSSCSLLLKSLVDPPPQLLLTSFVPFIRLLI